MQAVKIDVVTLANAGVELELFHPGTFENLGMFIHVLGRDSEEFRQLSSAQNRKRAQKLNKGGFRSGAITPQEELDADHIELLAGCTKAWRTSVKVPPSVDADVDLAVNPTPEMETVEFLMISGIETLACSPANAAAVYKAHPWIKEQVDHFIADRSNFSKGSAKP